MVEIVVRKAKPNKEVVRKVDESEQAADSTESAEPAADQSLTIHVDGCSLDLDSLMLLGMFPVSASVNIR